MAVWAKAMALPDEGSHALCALTRLGSRSRPAPVALPDGMEPYRLVFGEGALGSDLPMCQAPQTVQR